LTWSRLRFVADIGVAHLNDVSRNSVGRVWLCAQKEQSREHHARKRKHLRQTGSHVLGILAEYRLTVVRALLGGDSRSLGEATSMSDLVRSAGGMAATPSQSLLKCQHCRLSCA